MKVLPNDNMDSFNKIILSIWKVSDLVHVHDSNYLDNL